MGEMMSVMYQYNNMTTYSTFTTHFYMSMIREVMGV